MPSSRLRSAGFLVLALILCTPLLAQPQRAPVQAQASAPYYPERFDWQQRRPGRAGMDAAKLDAAIQFAIANENPATKDLAVDLATTFGREPFDTPIGPVQPRGALNGLVIRHGYVVAEWGETSRVDMTFSVTKSFSGRSTSSSARCWLRSSDGFD